MNRRGNVAGICLGVLCVLGAINPLRGQTTGAIVPVTLANTLAANDDDSTDAVPLNIGGSTGINFFGQTFTQVYVNNNGNLTFGDSFGDFTPNGLAEGVGLPIIAAFFADVDTTGTGSGLVQYGNATINGFPAFVANYINVGYFDANTDKLNSFQLALIDRSDTGAGNFDIEFNYNQILWETGDASGGTDGLGGTSAAVGYSNGLTGSNNVYYQVPGSLVNGALINGGPDALISHSLNSGVLGRYIFPVRNGVIAVLVSGLVCNPRSLAPSAVSTCTVTLTQPAPTGGASVTLSSGNNSLLTVPASVTVAAGANSATFSATAAATITGIQTATVTATFGGSAQTATILVGSGSQLLTVPGGSLSNITILTPNSQTLPATGGIPPYTWALVGGSLPNGMGLASNGTISGTPTRAGSYIFTARVTDSVGASAVGTFSINVAAQSVTITTPSPLPSGMVTVQYPLQVLSASGGFAPYTFTVPANALPAGLTLSSGGAISGTPTVTGTFPFTLTATDAAGQTGSKSLQLTVRAFSADLTVSAGSLSFSLAAGSTSLPGSETVQVESTDVTKVLSWSAAITPSVPWLSVASGSRTGSTTPGSFSVALTSAASSLAASTTPYQATIVVACLAPSPCVGSSQSIAVSLLVTTVPPELTVLTNLLSFTTSSTNSQATTQGLGVENAGGGSIAFTSVTCPQTWCVAGSAPASLGAGATGTINIQANPAGLSPGYYFTNLTIVSSAGTTTVPVTFFIATNSSLVLNASGVQVTMPAGGAAATPNTSFLVDVSGGAAGNSQVAWTATLLPGASWLNLNTSSGTSTSAAPGSVGYSINQSAAATLTPQAYYGTIRVVSAGVANSPQDFQVVLNVTAANAPQVPDPFPAGWIFITTANGTTAPQVDQIFASSVAAVPYQASAATVDGASWLSVSPATGTTSASAPAQSSISVNPTGLAAGVYHGSVYYSLAAAAVPTVNVTLIVEASGATSSQRNPGQPGAAAQSSCTPTQIVPTQTGLVNDFAEPASWPTPLVVQLNNDCGSPVTNGQVVTTFSNGDSPLALSLENSTSGLYAATWTPRTTGSQVTITATATAPGFAAATARISGSVVPNTAPVLTPNGTLHIFTPELGAPLAPGTIVQIYGSSLAAQTVTNSLVPVPTVLGGTSVIIGGIQAPLYFVSAGQVNAQIPFELTAGQPYQVIVSNNGALTTPQSIQSTAVTPGVAAFPSGYVEAQHASDFSLITDASPAKPGEYIVIYLAGMGPTTVPVASGAGAPSGPYALTADAPTITLNSEAVSVIYFSGLAPGFAGLYQIDLQVPADAPNGELPLVVSQPGFQGIPVILPVHN